MIWLLDTTTLLTFANRSKGYERIARKLAGRNQGEVRMSAVTLAELEHAAETSRSADENRAALAELATLVQVDAWPGHAAQHFAELKAALQKGKHQTRPYDLLVAAHARAIAATLVTAEPEAFGDMPGLKVANWLKA